MQIPTFPGNPTKIDIITRNYSSAMPVIGAFPAVVLTTDNWNDYGYKTSFEAELYLSPTQAVDLGVVKILRYEYGTEPYTTQLPAQMKALSEDLCSLGNSQEYYEKLNEIDLGIRNLYLRSMNDIVFDQNLKRIFEGRPGFDESLLRNPSAEAALTYAPFLLARDASISQKVEVTYVAPDGISLHLGFNSSALLPGRINAIIGYNGVGKTSILAAIAHVAATPVESRNHQSIAGKYGRFDQSTQRFSTTIAVSYSAFDSFEMPQSDDEKVNYYYFGLRRQGLDSHSQELKSTEERLEELAKALEVISTDKRRSVLDDALHPLLKEPSFSKSNTVISFHDGSWRQQFKLLSSGHQIALAIVVQLVAYMEINSLALIDEPESHLHPPLVAALMKGIGVALERTSSFAVLATHSPVVIQEVPASCVHVLRRTGDLRRFTKPSRETYGENLGVLTSEVFNLDNTESSFEGVLTRMAETLTADEIEDLFELGMSGQARAILMQEGVEF